MTEKVFVRRARALRRTANSSELKAWSILRHLRRHGYPVRRQHPVGPYIVDFAIIKAKLVIEIDGGIHRFDAVTHRDEVREKYLIDKGCRVLRIDAEKAINEDYLMRKVGEALGF